MDIDFPAPQPTRWTSPPATPLRHWKTVSKAELLDALANVRTLNMPYRIEADAEGATFKIRIEPTPQPKRMKPKKPLSCYRAAL